MRDELAEAFVKYLYHAKELLLSCFKIKQVDATIQMLKMELEDTEPLIDEKDVRDIKVGISRAEYYIKKMKDQESVEVSFIKEARAELDPLCDYMKEHMRSKE
jgi:hypothetical protein